MFTASFQCGSLMRARGWRRCQARAQASASPAVVWSPERRSRARLPPISFSYDPTGIDAEELADLLGQVARHAPGQSFHIPGGVSGSSSSERWEAAARSQQPHSGVAAPGSGGPEGSSSGGSAWVFDTIHDSPSCSPNSSSSERSRWVEAGEGDAQGRAARRRAAARLASAVRRSQACVAAYTSDQHLPEHQRLASRGLAVEGSGEGARWWRQRRVLVGFARAVGDSALVATVHDVAVMPELQGRGLGRHLLDRLTKQLWRQGVVDVGLLTPLDQEPFFEACDFGPDPEESTTMALSAAGAAGWARCGGVAEGDWAWVPRSGLRELLLRQPLG